MQPSGTKDFAIVHLESPLSGHVVTNGAVIEGKGWAVSRQEIADISVFLGEGFLCYASYGLPRADIGENFPTFRQPSHAGFVFSGVLPDDVESSSARDLIVKVRLAGGAISQRSVAVLTPEDARVPGPSRNHEIASALADLTPIRLFVEEARIDTRAILRIKGWAVSLLPIRKLELFLGEVSLEEPEMGLARVDVASDQPRYPNAALSGFRLVQDVGRIANQRPLVRAQVLCEGGLTRQVIVPLDLSHRQQRRVMVEDGSISVCCDSVNLRADGALSLEGWAVAPSEVTELRVTLDGEEVGKAEYGLGRPDVGNRFPQIPHARRSGFRFFAQLAPPLAGQHALALIVRSAGGSERRIDVPTQTSEVVREEPYTADLVAEAQNEIRYSLDSPRLSGGKMVEPLRGVLTVSGWGVARDGLESVNVYIDGNKVGSAYVGIRREDVAAAFPDIQEALVSGFALTVPHRLVGEGDHSVRVQILARSGRVIEKEFDLVSEKPEPTAAASIRRRMPHTEIDLKTAILAAQGFQPNFLVVILAEFSAPQGADELGRTLKSLSGQDYERWQCVVLCSSPGASDAELPALLPEKHLSGRIRTARAASQCDLRSEMRALQQEGPAYLMVLRAGDELGVDALLELAIEGALSGRADLIYGDERCFDFGLNEILPFRKPDWSPDLLTSMNYLGRSWCASAALVLQSSLTARTLLDHGDYDSVLRLTRGARTIGHVPKLLVDRAAMRAEEPELEVEALRRALYARNVEADVLPGKVRGTWRVRRHLASRPLVSIVMPTCAGRGLIKTAVESIRVRTSYPSFEIVVIDNIPAGMDPWKLWVRDNADETVDVPDPFNWSRFNNLGARAARGDVLLFMNDDIEVTEPDWLDALVEHVQRPEVGVVGPQLLYPDGKVQHAGLFLSGQHGRHAFRFAPADEPGAFGLALTQRNVIAVTGACMAMRREHFDHLGGFNEAHSIVNNDLDFCLRTWRGDRRVVYTPFASLIHHELASRVHIKDDFDEDQFASSWQSQFVKGDPFFNPMLAPDADEYVQESEPTEDLYPGHPVIGRDRVRKILVVKVDHIGDFVLALPAMRRLKQRFPKAELTVLAAKASLSLAHLEPAIDKVIEFNFFHPRSSLGLNTEDASRLASLKRELTAAAFDIAVDLRMQTDTRHLLQLSGATLLSGYDFGGRFPWLDVVLEWEGDMRLVDKRAHAADRLLQLVEAIAIACEGKPPSFGDLRTDEALPRVLGLPGSAEAPLGFFDRPLACIHAGAGSEMKEWPLESYAALINLLVDEQGMHVVLVGGPDEVEVAHRLRSMVAAPPSVHSFAGRLGLRELPILLQACRLYVGNDSGPKHIAASFGVPTLGVHSSNIDASEWGPLGPRAIAIRRHVVCGPCYIAKPSDCHRGLTCIRDLRAGDAYRAARLLLGLWPQADAGARRSSASIAPGRLGPDGSLRTHSAPHGGAAAPEA